MRIITFFCVAELQISLAWLCCSCMLQSAEQRWHVVQPACNQHMAVLCRDISLCGFSCVHQAESSLLKAPRVLCLGGGSAALTFTLRMLHSCLSFSLRLQHFPVSQFVETHRLFRLMLTRSHFIIPLIGFFSPQLMSVPVTDRETARVLPVDPQRRKTDL